MIATIETFLTSTAAALSGLSTLELVTAAGAFGYAVLGLWLMRILDRESAPAERKGETDYRKAA